ncbi:hypothetical protein ACWT_5647 [Actinoplanes sp. SE50]|nr:hypothetical protein ACPL_5777 [Actinoplanes sp. SE50/110]ATO85062.1 hypothetical protein ACWT_5647 [Actinoplanes sp. SE50]SLM02473.1 hypothetical protein ACSP50_5723 [Actinoplanes sp. SE50/110]
MARRLQQLQQRAQQLGKVASDLAAAAPQHVEGSDATGCVVATLGPDNLPADFRIQDRWHQRLEAEKLAPAVLAAYADAVKTKQRQWVGRLDQSGWWAQRRDAEAGWLVTEPAPAPKGGRPQPDDPEFAEQIMKTLRNAREQASQQPPASAQGTDAQRNVTVRLGQGGFVGCDIDTRWARSSSGTAISGALRTALQQAKRELKPSSTTFGEVDALVADALATLSALTRTQQHRGDHR